MENNRQSEIILLKGEGNYTMIHFENGKKVLITKTLHLLANIQPPHLFVRINRNLVINSYFITCWKRKSSRQLLVMLHDGQRLEVARRRIKEVNGFLKCNNITLP